MGWELIGGDPAPGSPDAVGSASSALRHVADIASHARSDLVTQTGAAGIEHWKGSAADAFRADVQKLPGDLGTVSTSYGEAAGALTTFRTVLEQAQSDALSILAAAQHAKADRDAADSRRRSAQSEVDALTVSHARAEASLLGLQAQQNLSLDPVHRASLTTPVTSAKTQVNRAAADLNSAKHAVATYAQQVKDADARLATAHQRADAVRRTVAAAVGNAVAVLQQAERDAHLPSWLTEQKQRAEQLLQTYGPKVVAILDIAQSVFSILAIIPTPLSGVFAGLALTCGILGLAVSFGVDATRPGGMTGGDMLDLGERALGVIAGGAAIKAARLGVTGTNAATGLKSAATWKKISTVAEESGKVVDVAKQGVDDGWHGLAVGAGGYVLGKGLEFGVAKGATGVAKHLNAVDANGDFKHPKAAAFLNDQSKGLRQDANAGKKLNATRSDDVHTMQSLLATGRRSEGTFLPGNQAATHYTPNDKMMSADDVTEALKHDVGTAYEGGKKTAEALDVLTSPPEPREPEIDIDLTPSQYGSSG